MINKIFTRPGTRFAMIFQISTIALAVFMLLRCLFLIRAWKFMDHNFFEIFYIFGQGLVYDTAFVSYFYIPFVLVLFIIPNKWLNTITMGLAAQATGFLIIYGICFSLVSEWLFWDEFSVRFNFISVDYLVYRRRSRTISLNPIPCSGFYPFFLL